MTFEAFANLPGEIHITQDGDNPPVVLYGVTHADELATVIATALDHEAHKTHWNDHEVLTRIICDELCDAKSSALADIGIGTQTRTNSDTEPHIACVFLVNPDEKTVTYKRDFGPFQDRTGWKYTFNDFITSITQLQHDSDVGPIEYDG